jgi:tetratricopeptide (TPR) repeat protein
MAKGFGKKTTNKVPKRKKAYLKLIEKLLSCPSGKEEKVLRNNSDLIDAGLVEEMTKVAATLAEEGELDTAEFLIEVAEDLAANLERLSSPGNLSESEEEIYFGEFLWQLVSNIETNDSNPDTAAPILQAYLQKDPDFIKKGRNWLSKKMSEATPKDAIGYANILGYFGNIIAWFPFGDTAQNLEEAIACFEIILSVANKKKLPQANILKSDTLRLLGTAYCRRIKGDNAENLEKGIATLKEALELITRESVPEIWGFTQNSLGVAYRDRILGDKADNIELSLAALEEALKVRDRDNFPHHWAQTKMNLAAAYSYRVEGEKAENLELAKAANEAALEVYTSENSPVDWSQVQLNQGNVYFHRIKGEKSDNLEKAIACYNNALQVVTKSEFPYNWATIKTNLGNAYKDSEITKAIACYREAFEIFTPTNFPQDCYQNGCKMGSAAFAAKLWPEAIEGFTAAVKVVEPNLSKAESETPPEKIEAEVIDIYEKLAIACTNNGQLDLAKEYASISASLCLVNQVTNNNLD